MHASKRGTLGVLLVALAALSVSLPVPTALADPECAPGVGVGSCTLSGDALGGVYVYDSITIPSGSTVSATLAITLHARQNLDVEGAILAPAVTLVSDQQATINGLVRSADGDATNPNGGSLHVLAAFLTVGGTLASGNGAPGQDQTQDVAGLLPIASAAGTAGGNGGEIVVSSPSATLTGQIILGNGGNGGSAFAYGGTNLSTAKAGAGGASGVLALPPNFSPIVLAETGILLGGRGGNGGSSIAAAPDVSVIGTPGDASKVDNSQFTACTGISGNTAGAKGGGGCFGGDTRAEAGDGGPGLIQGGDGGAATSFAGRGGMGGHGGNGNCPTSCGPGGPGGNGGQGGDGAAIPGNGGTGLIYGGNGGKGQGIGGIGGNGGTGGTGTFHTVPQCQESALTYCGDTPTTECFVGGGGGAGGPGGPGFVDSSKGKGGTAFVFPGHDGQAQVFNGPPGSNGSGSGVPSPPCGDPPGFFTF